MTARWGTSTAAGRSSTMPRTRANCPGRMILSGLGNAARMLIVPVFVSTARSTNTTRPFCGNVLPSASSRDRTGPESCTRPVGSSRMRGASFK